MSKPQEFSSFEEVSGSGSSGKLKSGGGEQEGSGVTPEAIETTEAVSINKEYTTASEILEEFNEKIEKAHHDHHGRPSKELIDKIKGWRKTTYDDFIAPKRKERSES